ncbi:MAG TPA: discoidin domain-containing protein [Pyrinomonadaceae bacterium]|nr:discoidin domain-containing protein [Pyrinomonadaceae bacterium]
MSQKNSTVDFSHKSTLLRRCNRWTGSRLPFNRIKYLLALLLLISPTVGFIEVKARLSQIAPEDGRINVAATQNGGAASASSFAGDAYAPGSILDGDRKGLNWGVSGGWKDASPNEFPDWVQVDFERRMRIDEVDVFALQDAWWNPIEPTLTMISNNNGITNFEVQYWNGSDWFPIPGAAIQNDNKVWTQFQFTAVDTDKIRVMVNAGRGGNSIIVELEAYGVPVADPDPTPTPSPSPIPNDGLTEKLAARDIYIDPELNIGIGTPNPIFNDDGTTGAFVGKWFAIDGKLPGAAAYLGLGGTIPGADQRVGVLNFYNLAMGGADHRTAAIYSFNGSQLGTGNLEFYTTPNFIGPVRRMQIAPTGEIGINHAAGQGTMVSIMGKTADSTTKALVVLDGIDRAMLTVRGDGEVSLGRPGQGIVLKSPNGKICRKLTIDDSGNLVVQPMGSCP